MPFCAACCLGWLETPRENVISGEWEAQPILNLLIATFCLWYGTVRAEMSCRDQNYSVSVCEGIFSDSVLDSREAQLCMQIAVKDMFAVG